MASQYHLDPLPCHSLLGSPPALPSTSLPIPLTLALLYIHISLKMRRGLDGGRLARFIVSAMSPQGR